MDNTAQEFARKIVGKLAHISNLLEGSIAPRQERGQANPEQNDANQKRNATEVHPPLAPKSTPSNQNPKEPQKRWHERIPWWKIVEGVGIGAAVFYARITYLQWQDLRHNFEVDERAWVSVESSHAEFNPSENIPDGRAFMHVMLDLKNVGKTPAAHVIMNGSYEIRGTEISFGFKTPWNIEIPLSPGQTHVADFWVNAPVGAVPPITAPDLSRSIQSGVTTAKFSADITYIDIFGKPRRTLYCATYDPRVKALGYYGGCIRSMD